MDVKKRRRDEYAQATRAAVLGAAAEAFAERGFDKTTIDDIAQGARVAKGTVYYHFTDKSMLFEAVFRERQESLVRRASEAALAVQGGAPAQLAAGLAAYLEGAVHDEAHRRLLAQAAAALGTERCRRLDEELALPLIVNALQQAADAGQLAPGVTAGSAARMLFAGLCDAVMTAGTQPDPARACKEAEATLRAVCFGGLLDPTRCNPHG